MSHQSSASLLPSVPACLKVLWLPSFAQTDLGLLAPSAAIPFIRIYTRMAPKASRQKGKGAASDGDAAPASLSKGSWEGSWVKEKRIELLRQGRVLPSADLMGCRPTGSKLVLAPQPGEAVVFYDHFPRGFALPASDFLRHHIGEMR
jgi:hypothetical protein